MMTMPDGGKYDGEWRADMFEGRGVMTFSDGGRYEGEWRAGMYDGRGVQTLADGEVYDGEFKADVSEGRGTQTFPDGRRYEGEWKADMMEGRGLATLADGRIFEGRFNGDMPVSGQMVELGGAVFLASFDGKTAIWDWQPTDRRRVGALEGGRGDARRPGWLREFAWDEGGGRFGGSWRGTCPVAGTLVKADGSEWAVVYDGRTTFAEGAAPVVEVRAHRRAGVRNGRAALGMGDARGMWRGRDGGGGGGCSGGAGAWRRLRRRNGPTRCERSPPPP